MKSIELYAPGLKVGSIVMCVKRDDEVEDFGLSGIVLEGRYDEVVGQEYEVTLIDDKNVPEDSKKKTTWSSNTIEEFYKVQRYWLLLNLKDLKTGKFLTRAWYHNYKLK